MKTNILDSGKRKFFFTGILALASLKIFNVRGDSQAVAATKDGSSKSIEERIASLEHDNMRLHAINEIQNLMGRYETIHTSYKNYLSKTWELYARHTPGTWMEKDEGWMYRADENWGDLLSIPQ